MTDIAVVHLVWEPAGLEPLTRFIRAYRSRPAGIDHDLVVVLNGFAGKPTAAHREALNELTYQAFEVPDPVLDIAAYRWVAGQLAQRYVCFLNSYSEPLEAGWLAQLNAAITTSGVGAAGATGSWESHYTDYLLAVRADGSALSNLKWPVRAYRAARYRASFPAAPNPHLRSNGLIIERARWLAVAARPIQGKWAALKFESGRQSMTRDLQSAGLDVVVVGRDGVHYRRQDWPASRTFHTGGQTNLLISDNRTRQYDEADERERSRLNTLAWGRGRAPL